MKEKYCVQCGKDISKWNIDYTMNITCGECNIGYVNFIQMLESRYKTQIKKSADYVELRSKWIREGAEYPETENVPLRGSQDAVGGSVQRIVGWNYKENPIKWEDQ